VKIIKRIHAIVTYTPLYSVILRSKRFIIRKNKSSFLESISFYKALGIKDKIVFDIGANVGLVSEILANAGAKHVYAFEPNLDLIPILNGRLRRHRVSVVAAACSSSPAVSKLYIPHFSGQSSFDPSWPDTPITETKIVPLVTLSSVMKLIGKPYYIKIDTEGHEKDVIHGLDSIIPILSFEFHSDERLNDVIDILRTYSSLGSFDINFGS